MRIKNTGSHVNQTISTRTPFACSLIGFGTVHCVNGRDESVAFVSITLKKHLGRNVVGYSYVGLKDTGHGTNAIACWQAWSLAQNSKHAVFRRGHRQGVHGEQLCLALFVFMEEKH